MSPWNLNLGKQFSERDTLYTLPIEINRELVYKDIRHGWVVLPKDDECTGSTVKLDREIHDVLSYDTTTVLVKEIIRNGKGKSGQFGE